MINYQNNQLSSNHLVDPKLTGTGFITLPFLVREHRVAGHGSTDKKRSINNLKEEMIRNRAIKQVAEKQQYFERLLCLYDGIKLRSYNEDYINWLKLPKQRKFFDLQPTFTVNGETEVKLQGKYLNIDIVISYQGRWVVDFSGSVHKLFNILVNNGAHNYNDFFWSDFLQVYDVMVTVFKFNPDDTEVVNLEAGINIVLPDWFKLTITELLDNIISLHGVCKNKSSIEKSDRHSYTVEKGDCYVKGYSKTAQHKLLSNIIRLELGCSRARPIIKLGRVKYFSGLCNLSSLIAFKFQLIEVFRTIHIHHPELANLPLEVIEADREILTYSNPSFWCKQKKNNRYQYEKKRKNHETLITRYCSSNVKEDVLRMIEEKLR